MSADSKDSLQGHSRSQNAILLTHGVEKIFRRLIAFLVGKISLVKLQEIIRLIYVEETERKLRSENPGRDVPLTRLALLTGLDTRTLAKTRNDERYRKPIHEVERFVKTMTPESCVLDIWLSKPDYLDPASGEPKILKVSGKGSTFEELVKESVSSRGVTVQSILTSLLQNQAVIYDEEKDSVELLEMTLAPYKVGNHWGVFEVGLLHVCSLIETVFHNFKAVSIEETPYFQRGCWTHRLNINDRVNFEKEMRELLESTEMKARSTMAEFEEMAPSINQVSAGVSMFYFEEDTTDA